MRAMRNEHTQAETGTDDAVSGMRRVCIIGCGGAGKSTLAVRLGSLLDLPVVHLDAVYWKPDWQKPPQEEWQRRHRDLLCREAWILDGNYGGTMKERIEAGDTVILLALSRFTCLFQVFRRAIRHLGRSRPDIHPGCREQLPDREFLGWIWNYNRTRLPGILEYLERIRDTKNVVILRSGTEVEKFVNALKKEADRGGLRQAGAAPDVR